MPALKERKRMELILPKNIYQAVEAYRMGLVNRPTRNFIIAEALVDWLKTRGVTVQPLTTGEGN